jgi:transposase InsO family protein
MIPRILERLDQARREFTWTELCQGLLPCATVLRWKSRARAGEPLIEAAGPKKNTPLDTAAIQKKIRELHHGRRRTAGTTALMADLQDEVSRRRFQEMVAEERQNRMKDMKRIYWLKPGTAWSLDTTEYGPDKTKITPLRDLASKYQVPIPLVAPEENGEHIALYLDQMFRQEGPPMFLKRDLGSPLNCAALDQVLERHRVLPLNSPPAWPQYNGSMERSMRDLKDALDARRRQPLLAETPLVLKVELVTHQLNHRRLRSLGGLTPCQFYHDPGRRLRLHAATREKIFREVFEQYWQYVQCMPGRNRHLLNAAWRLVVESWLRRQGWISVRDNRQPNVSTNSKPFFSHN